MAEHLQQAAVSANLAVELAVQLAPWQGPTLFIPDAEDKFDRKRYDCAYGSILAIHSSLSFLYTR